MVSLRKALRRRLYLLGRTWRNKTRLPELNLEVLGGLSILRYFCNQEKDQMLTTSQVKRKAEKKKLKILEIAGPKSFQYWQEHKVCQDNDLYWVVYTAQTKARQALDRSRKFVKTTIYTEWSTQRRWKLEQTTTQRKFWSWTSKVKTSRQRRHEQK